ncbi:hypothetical protein QBC47DRAFT_414328 [Echria macrotheca]|uniref:Uncharacterized protein n=1 Tax=Echria macrotheca TaxID=438768 RepID=A0AAJ0F8G7_9PEZI|nr:hypothetical protein QBC47DRAFT_414328 [Echria macrotheca]
MPPKRKVSAAPPADDSASEAPPAKKQKGKVGRGAYKPRGQGDTEDALTAVEREYKEVSETINTRFEKTAWKTRYRTVKEEEMNHLLECPHPPGWTEQDEAQLQDAWRTDELRTLIERKPFNDFMPQLELWKFSLQYLRCAPTSVLGVENNFEIDRSEWTAFEDLMFHHLWKHSNVRALVIVLQFAVIVRTDDRRTWELENHTDSKFIDELIVEIRSEAEKEPARRRSIVELCKAVRLRASRSPWSHLFKQISEAYKRSSALPQAPVLEGSFAKRPYVISTKDLKLVVEAADLDGAYGRPPPATLRLARVVGSSHDSSYTAPLGRKMVEVLTKAALDERRKALNRAKGNGNPEAQVSAAPAPGDQGEERPLEDGGQGTGQPAMPQNLGMPAFGPPSIDQMRQVSPPVISRRLTAASLRSVRYCVSNPKPRGDFFLGSQPPLEDFGLEDMIDYSDDEL